MTNKLKGTFGELENYMNFMSTSGVYADFAKIMSEFVENLKKIGILDTALFFSTLNDALEILTSG